MLMYCGEMPARRSNPSELVAETMPSASRSDQSMSKNWLPAISPSSETVVSVLMSLWIVATYFLSSSSLFGSPMNRVASSGREYSSPRCAERNSMRRNLRSTSLPVWNELFLPCLPSVSSSSPSPSADSMDWARTLAAEELAESSASWNCVAAFRRRRKAATASGGLTTDELGCSSTNMARSSASV